MLIKRFIFIFLFSFFTYYFYEFYIDYISYNEIESKIFFNLNNISNIEIYKKTAFIITENKKGDKYNYKYNIGNEFLFNNFLKKI